MDRILVLLIILMGITIISNSLMRSKHRSADILEKEIVSEIKKMKGSSREDVLKNPESLEFGLKVVTGEIPKPLVKRHRKFRLKREILDPIIAKLDERDIDITEREQALELLLPEAGKNPELDNEIYRVSINSLEKVLNTDPKVNDDELKKQIDLSLIIMFSTKKKYNEVIQEAVNLLDKISDDNTKNLVINSMAMHLNDNQPLIDELKKANIKIPKNINH